jgi:predicted nucleic acid-binding protein
VRFKSKEGDFEEFVNMLYKSSKLIVENRSDARELHLLLGYEGQCNWEIAPSLLKMIGELGLTLTITCYEANDADVIK